MRALPIVELSLHEQSRIVVTFQDQVLGWVSNYGDAAARACDLLFQGGGRHDAKEHVYVIHASILNAHAIQRIVLANAQEDHRRVWIPRNIQEGGLHAETIPLEDFRFSRDVFAMLPRVTKPLTSCNKRSFPLLEPIVHPGWGIKNGGNEALACPFGFLIPSSSQQRGQQLPC